MTPPDLEGTWSLESCLFEYDDGRITYPVGHDVTGVIVYSRGRVSVMFGARDRTPFALTNPYSSTEAERAAAFLGFFAYSGTYDVVGDLVVHHVDICHFPNWEGVDQHRSARLDGDRLLLEGRAGEGTPRASTMRLVWTRMEPHQPLR
jgi:hypothetical protein